MSRPSAHHLCYGLAAILAITGLALTIAPTTPLAVPALPGAGDTPNAPPPFTKDFGARFSMLFDLSVLPEPMAPPTARKEAPPPDPAAALRKYRYLGGARAGERNAALFENGGAIITLRIGEALAEFTLIAFDAEAATFRKGEFEASLQLIRQ